MNKKALKETTENIVEFLFPLNHTCNNCGREIFNGNYFCEDCENEFYNNNKTICNHCGRRTFNNEEYCFSCSGRETYFNKARSVYLYATPVNRLIAQLKYNNKKYLAKIFAPKLVEVYYRNFFNCDLVTFTPMTKERESERGYNQAKILAEEFCKLTELKLVECLVKTKETPRQATISSAKERRENLKGSFKVVNKEEVKGKTVLLIDDVMTTGATVECLCEELVKAKVKEIYVLTVASVSKGEEGKV